MIIAYPYLTKNASVNKKKWHVKLVLYGLYGTVLQAFVERLNELQLEWLYFFTCNNI